MEWAEMIPAHTMAQLLDKFFFPKWLHALNMWLNINPDYEQISQWFTGWKNIIPDSLKTQPAVTGSSPPIFDYAKFKLKFPRERILIMINRGITRYLQIIFAVH